MSATTSPRRSLSARLGFPNRSSQVAGRSMPTIKRTAKKKRTTSTAKAANTRSIEKTRAPVASRANQVRSTSGWSCASRRFTASARFARRDIPKGTRIIEYTGEKISNAEADRRYDDARMERHHTFLFILNSRTCVDAAFDGNEVAVPQPLVRSELRGGDRARAHLDRGDASGFRPERSWSTTTSTRTIPTTPKKICASTLPLRRAELPRDDRQDSTQADQVTALRALLAGSSITRAFPAGGARTWRRRCGTTPTYAASDEAWMLGRFVVPSAHLDAFGQERSALRNQPEWRVAGAARRGRRRRHRAGSRIQQDDGRQRACRHARRKGGDDRRGRENRRRGVRLQGLRRDSRDRFHAGRRCRRTRAQRQGSHRRRDRRHVPGAGGASRVHRHACRANVPFKATAGLHHATARRLPLTYDEDSPKGPMFGFLNVFLAAAFVHAGMTDGAALALLLERDVKKLLVSSRRDCVARSRRHDGRHPRGARLRRHVVRLVLVPRAGGRASRGRAHSMTHTGSHAVAGSPFVGGVGERSGHRFPDSESAVRNVLSPWRGAVTHRRRHRRSDRGPSLRCIDAGAVAIRSSRRVLVGCKEGTLNRLMTLDRSRCALSARPLSNALSADGPIAREPSHTATRRRPG